jgi:CheY-like chemotaxis protein
MRILVADDDEVSALVLSERLEDLGYQVTVAQDGAEAWRMMQEAEYRLLVLDWMMPEMDGMELCRRVREVQTDRYIYIILLTGRTDRRDRLEALEGGADDFLTKPLDQAELMARLKAADRILSSDEALRQTNHQLQLARSKELEIGAHIQQRLLYSPPPTSINSIRTASLSIPSQSVDGDFCDFFELGENIVDVVVGDVMGKGVAAAMVGAGVKTSLQRSLLTLMTKKKDFLLLPPSSRI